MIDMHSHILPGVDDGSRSIEESVEMARLAVADGITKIFATPHYGNGRFQVGKEDVLELTAELNARFAEEQIPLEVCTGHEVRISRTLLEDLQEGRVLTLAGSDYLLLELPTGEVPKYTADMVYELTLKGITPIIAHPERNVEIAQNPEKLEELVELGALGQLTTHSVNGAFGRKIVKVSEDLCRRGLIHLVANDAHHPGLRGFGMLQTNEELEKSFGQRYVAYLRQNAIALLSNEEIDVIQGWKPTKKWFGLFTK